MPLSKSLQLSRRRLGLGPEWAGQLQKVPYFSSLVAQGFMPWLRVGAAGFLGGVGEVLLSVGRRLGQRLGEHMASSFGQKLYRPGCEQFDSPRGEEYASTFSCPEPSAS